MTLFFASWKSSTRKLMAVTMLLLVGAGALIADTVSKQRDAMTTVTLELCKKGANGQWEVIDRAKGPANFTASVMDLASGKEMTSAVNWNVKSEKGRQMNVKLARAVKVNLNPTSGLMQLDTPLMATVDGMQIPLNVKLTTESMSTPIGQLSGKKADLNLSTRTLTADVVGFTSVKQRAQIDRLLGVEMAQGKLVDQIKAKEGQRGPGAGNVGNIRTPGAVGGSAGLIDELIVVVKGGGRVVAK